MKQSKYDLKKICTGVVLFFFVYGGLVLLISRERIGASRLGYGGAAVVFAAAVLLLAAYGAWIVRCDKTGRKSFGLYAIRTVEKYQFLIEQLVTRDFKIKYKRSVLGVFWSFLNPLLMMVVQYMVFSNLMKFSYME